MNTTEKCLLAGVAAGAIVPIAIGGGIGIAVGGSAYSLPFAMQSLIAGSGAAVTTKAFTGPVRPAPPSLFEQLVSYYSSEQYDQDFNDALDVVEQLYAQVGLGWLPRAINAPFRTGR